MKNKALSLLFAMLSPLLLYSEGRPYVTGEWGGARQNLSKWGVDIGSDLILDATWNLHGGKKRQGAKVEYLFDLNVSLKSEKLLHYPGGLFFVDFETHQGATPSVSLIGSFDFIDNIETQHFTELYALWYRQSFLDEALWFQVGKSDAYDHFSIAKHASLFLNSGFTFLPSSTFFPTYPDTAMSVVASATFVKGVSMTLGVFDGSFADGFNTGKAGVFGHFFHHLGSHAYLIGEVDFEWNQDKGFNGRLGIGGWRDTAKFDVFGGGTKSGTGGPYVTLDQTLLKTEKVGDIGAFFIYGSANPRVSEVHRYFGTGVSWKSPFYFSRVKDVVGIGMSRIQFSHKKGSGFSKMFETAYELFYLLQITPWFYIEPDIQYITHPGGKGLPNATAFTLRLDANL